MNILPFLFHTLALLIFHIDVKKNKVKSLFWRDHIQSTTWRNVAVPREPGAAPAPAVPWATACKGRNSDPRPDGAAQHHIPRRGSKVTAL